MTAEGSANLANVDEDAKEYDAKLHNRIFVAEEVEGMLQLEQLSLAGESGLPRFMPVKIGQIELQGSVHRQRLLSGTTDLPGSVPHLEAEPTADSSFRLYLALEQR